MNETLTTKAIGDQAEDLAARYLIDQGLVVVARNVRNRRGEIDIIARDGKVLVFVEVRLRRSSAFGGARGSLTYGKQKRLAAAAKLYLSQLKRQPLCRFDAILLDALSLERIKWVRNMMSVSEE